MAGMSEKQAAHTEPGKRPGAFSKGDRRINRTSGPHSQTKAEESGSGSVPRLLRDMRRITRTSATRDRTELQKRLRKVYENDFKEFFRQLVQLERAYLREQSKVAKARGTEPSMQNEVVEDDEGTQRARELIERTFAAFQGKE
jgi:hypothetical protein